MALNSKRWEKCRQMNLPDSNTSPIFLKFKVQKRTSLRIQRISCQLMITWKRGLLQMWNTMQTGKKFTGMKMEVLIHFLSYMTNHVVRCMVWKLIWTVKHEITCSQVDRFYLKKAEKWSKIGSQNSALLWLKSHNFSETCKVWIVLS